MLKYQKGRLNRDFERKRIKSEDDNLGAKKPPAAVKPYLDFTGDYL